MLFEKIDVVRVRRDVASASAECRACKRALRVTWTRPMADEQRALARLARRVTELCVLLARLRGRWHLAGPPRGVLQAGTVWDREAYHERVAARVARDYAMPEAEAPRVEGP